MGECCDVLGRLKGTVTRDILLTFFCIKHSTVSVRRLNMIKQFREIFRFHEAIRSFQSNFASPRSQRLRQNAIHTNIANLFANQKNVKPFQPVYLRSRWIYFNFKKLK